MDDYSASSLVQISQQIKNQDLVAGAERQGCINMHLFLSSLDLLNGLAHSRQPNQISGANEREHSLENGRTFEAELNFNSIGLHAHPQFVPPCHRADGVCQCGN